MGVWVRGVGGGCRRPEDLAGRRPEGMEVGQGVRVGSGQEKGSRGLEEVVIGPYGRAGLTEMLDGAR